jgi:hypothetical protein
MKIISDELESARICRHLEIETDDIDLKTGLPVVLNVYKWASCGDYDELDWEWADLNTSKKVYEAMTEEKQEEVLDIINDYKLKWIS